MLEASDGWAALARLDAGERVDLLVADVSMPGMDGIALARQARRRRPGLPVVLLTGMADGPMTTDARDTGNGITTLLRKPLSGNVLAERAAALLEQARLSRRPAAADWRPIGQRVTPRMTAR